MPRDPKPTYEDSDQPRKVPPGNPPAKPNQKMRAPPPQAAGREGADAGEANAAGAFNAPDTSFWDSDADLDLDAVAGAHTDAGDAQHATPMKDVEVPQPADRQPAVVAAGMDDQHRGRTGRAGNDPPERKPQGGEPPRQGQSRPTARPPRPSSNPPPNPRSTPQSASIGSTARTEIPKPMTGSEMCEQLVRLGLVTLREWDEAVRLAGGNEDNLPEIMRQFQQLPATWDADLPEKFAVLTSFQVKEIKAGRAEQLRLKDYVILDEIGRGGMGRVCKARKLDALPRLYAVKTILYEGIDASGSGTRSRARDRFHQEATLLTLLRHPNLPTIYDFGEANGVAFIAMDFIVGDTLEQIAERAKAEGNAVDWTWAVETIISAAEVLRHAHEREYPVIHRDIKPNNIMLTANQQPMLLDLGIAKLVRSGGPEDLGITNQGQRLGTPHFMAPEQWGDAGSVTPAADIYSLGATLYYILTGQVPFPAEHQYQLYNAVMTQERPRLTDLRPDCPAQLDEIIIRSLAVKAEDRYASAAEFIAALQEVVAPVVPPYQRKLWPLIAGGATLVVVAAIAGVVLKDTINPTPLPVQQEPAETADSKFGRGLEAYKAGKFDEAENLVSAALQQTPGLAGLRLQQAHWVRGVALAKHTPTDPGAIAKEFDEAQGYNQGTPEEQRIFGAELRKYGGQEIKSKPAESLRHLQAALRLLPAAEHAPIKSDIVQAQIELKDYRAALATLQDLLKDKPANAEALQKQAGAVAVELAEQLKNQNDTDGIIANFEQAEKNGWLKLDELGQVKRIAAQAYLERGIRSLKPNNQAADPQVYNNAIADLELALKLDPKFLRANAWLGVAHARLASQENLEEFQKAEENFAKAGIALQKGTADDGQMQQEVAANLIAWGDALANKKPPEQPTTILDKYTQAAKWDASPRTRAMANDRAGLVYRDRLNKKEAAHDSFAAGLRIAQALGDQDLEQRIKSNLKSVEPEPMPVVGKPNLKILPADAIDQKDPTKTLKNVLAWSKKELAVGRDLERFATVLKGYQEAEKFDATNSAAYRQATAEIHLEYAKALAQAGKHADAIQQCFSAIEIDPKNWQALGLRGVEIVEGGDVIQYELAATDLDTAFKNLANGDATRNLVRLAAAKLHGRLGQKQLSAGESAAARAEFERVLTFDPTNQEARYNIGVTYFREKEYEKALQQFTTAKNSDAKSGDAGARLFMTEGDRARDLPDYDRALVFYDDAAKLAVDESSRRQIGESKLEIYLKRASQARGREQWEKAINDYTAALRQAKQQNQNQKQVDALVGLAMTYVSKGENDQRVFETLQEAQALAKDKADELGKQIGGAFAARAIDQRDKREFASAKDSLELAIKADPTSKGPYKAQLAKLLFKTSKTSSDIDRVITAWEEAFAADRSQLKEFGREAAAVLITRADRNATEKNYEQAIQDYSKAIEWNVTIPDAYRKRAIARWAFGNQEILAGNKEKGTELQKLARGDFDEAIGQNKQDLAAYLLLKTLLERDLHEGADRVLECKERIAELDPKAENYFDLAKDLLAAPNNLKNPKKAVESAQRACELTNNKNYIYLMTLALAYADNNEFQKAIDTAEKAKQAAPNLSDSERDGLNTKISSWKSKLEGGGSNQ